MTAASMRSPSEGRPTAVLLELLAGNFSSCTSFSVPARKTGAVPEDSSITNHAAQWLRDWLSTAEVAAEPFRRTDFTEQVRPPNLPELLALMLMDAKCDLELTRRLLARLGWIVAGARLRQSDRIQARHGDFGEVLTLG